MDLRRALRHVPMAALLCLAPAMLGWTGDRDRAWAQPPFASPALSPPAACPLPPPQPSVVERGPRPAEELETFVRSITSNDAQFHVLVNHGRLLTLQSDLVEPEKQSPLIAVGDPSVIDFEVVGPRHIRVTGRKVGVTDLSIVTADNENYSFEVHVIADLEFLAVRLRQAFPDASLELSQVREHVVVEGQARDARQVAQIVEMITAYMLSVQTSQATKITSEQAAGAPATPMVPQPPPGVSPQDAPPRAEVLPGSDRPDIEAELPLPIVINLIRVPGPQQVLLKVQVAELNRTALREFGVSFFLQDENAAIGSAIGPAIPPAETGGGGGAVVTNGAAALLGLVNPIASGVTSTVFGIFDRGGANFFIDALRRNQVLKILAEPNLVAMNGQEANFLSGGEFPVPVPQPSAAGAGLVTIQYRPFGVGLTFVPYILDDDKIRLSVAPEVSSIDFTTGVFIQGTAVPGINTRRTSTMVELREGQTLAISGILQVTLDGTTTRVPGLGDLPYIGPFFSNNSTQTVEKELVVLVTPYLVEAMEPEQVPVLPGAEVLDPTDCEFYLKGRIERRACDPFRATTAWDDPLGVGNRRALESHYICGPYGYTE